MTELGRYASAVSFNIFGWNKGVQKVWLFDLLVYYKLKMGGILAAEEKKNNRVSMVIATSKSLCTFE